MQDNNLKERLNTLAWKTRKLPFLAVALCAGIALSVYLWPRLFGFYLLNRMSPSTRAQFTAYESQPVHFPNSWSVVAPIDQTVEAQLVRFTGQLAQHTREQPQRGTQEAALLSQLNNQTTLTVTEWEQVEKLVEDHSSWTLELITAAKAPEYELQLLFPVYTETRVKDGASALTKATRFVALHAYLLDKQGYTTQSLQMALGILHTCKRHPASSVTAHLLACSIQSSALATLDNLSMNCRDPQILRQTLNEMNQLASVLNPMVLHDAPLLLHITDLRALQRSGQAVDLSPGKPESYYDWQWSGRTNLPYQHPKARLLRILHFKIRANSQVASAKEHSAKALYESTCLSIAERVVLLERQSGIDVDLKSLIPEELLPPAQTETTFTVRLQ